MKSLFLPAFFSCCCTRKLYNFHRRTKMSTPKPILGYWDMRGIVQPIRLLLAYTGVDYIDRRYSMANNGTEWYEEKFNLGLDFPNLPYYIAGDLKLTQSLAILQHLAREHGLCGKTPLEQARISLAEQQVVELNKLWWETINAKDYACAKEVYLNSLPIQLSQLSIFLGDRPFTAGTSLSYVDFLLYEYLLRVYCYAQDTVTSFANLYRFLERIESLPRLAAYIKSSKASPFVPKGLNWSGMY